MKIVKAAFLLAIVGSTSIALCQQPLGERASTECRLAKECDFEVATIKPFRMGDSGSVGFYSYQDGRVLIGAATVKMLIRYAFNVDESLIEGPSWIGEDRFNVVAKAPRKEWHEQQPSVSARPTAIQREMMKKLLQQRFGLQLKVAESSRAVLVLKRKSHSPDLIPTTHPEHDPRGGIFVRPNGVIDGTAMAANLDMQAFAAELSSELGKIVVNETGLEGGFDFKLPAFDQNNTDMLSAAIHVTHALGLELNPGKRDIPILQIEAVQRPDPN